MRQCLSNELRRCLGMNLVFLLKNELCLLNWDRKAPHCLVLPPVGTVGSLRAGVSAGAQQQASHSGLRLGSGCLARFFVEVADRVSGGPGGPGEAKGGCSPELPARMPGGQLGVFVFGVLHVLSGEIGGISWGDGGVGRQSGKQCLCSTTFFFLPFIDDISSLR